MFVREHGMNKIMLQRYLAIMLVLISVGVGMPFAWAGSSSAISDRATVDTRSLVSPPSCVQATTTLANKIAVTWNSVGASGYEVYRSTGNNPNGLLPLAANVAVTYFDDYFATPGVTYYYWVKSKNASGPSSSFSSPAAAGLKCVILKPEAPTGVRATQGTYEDKVVVEWDAVPGAEYYEVRRRVDFGLSDDDLVFPRVIPPPSGGRVSYNDADVFSNAHYQYYVRALSRIGTSGVSEVVVGYASGRPNAQIAWDTERTFENFGDSLSIRAVRVVDTANTRIQTKRQFVVRVYLRTDTFQDRCITNVTVRLAIDGTNVSEVVGTVFPRWLFRYWRSFENMALQYEAPDIGLTPVQQIMRRGLDTINLFISADKCPTVGLHEMKVDIIRCGSTVLSQTNTVEFVDSVRGLTIIRVPVVLVPQFISQTGEWRPDPQIVNDQESTVALIKAAYPYREVHCVDVKTACVSVWGEQLFPLTLAAAVAKAAWEQNRSDITTAWERGDHVLYCGLVPKEFFNFAGDWAGVYPGFGSVILCKTDDADYFPFIVAHELGHLSWFDLGESYVNPDWPFGKRSSFNPQSPSTDDRSGDRGNLVLPTMGAFNLDLPGYTRLPQGMPIMGVNMRTVSGWGYEVEGNLKTCALMAAVGYNWAEQNEYKRFCDVLLPPTSLKRTLANAFGADNEPGQYTGTVAMISASWATNSSCVIAPLQTLDNYSLNISGITGSYRVVEEDIGGSILHQIWTTPQTNASVISIGVQLPFSSDVQTLRLFDDQGQELAARHRSPSIPAVLAIACTETNGWINLEWQTEDADGDELWHCLYYSGEGGSFLGPIVNMVTNKQISLPAGVVPGGTGVVWKVVVSDGFNFGEGASSSMSLSNRPPTCAFARDFRDTLEKNIAYSFTCFVSDLEDGSVLSSNITWFLDDSVFATGTSVSVCSSVEGWHELRLEVRDSDDQVGMTTAMIFVHDPAVTPIANAGPDTFAIPGQTVQLDGSASTDPQSNALLYCWQQVSGTNAPLSDSNSVNPTFTMPDIPQDASLTYELTVSNGSSTGKPDRVTITHIPSTVVVAPGLVTFPVTGGTTSITVIATSIRTPWDVGNSNDWVSVVSFGSGSGNGTVTLSVGTNTTTGGRTAPVSIGDQTVTVQQDYDSDGDGMPDSWETRFGLNPHDPGDAVLDNDGDALSNLAEYQAGTDPTKKDTDGDSLPDGWEVKFGHNPNDNREGLYAFEGAVSTNGSAQGLCVQSNLAYLADGTNGLVIVDINISTNPIVVGGCVLTGMAYDVSVDGNRACVALGTNGVALLDTGNPTNPAFLGMCSTPGTAWGVQLVAGHAYVASGDGGLVILDTSSSESFTNVGTCSAVGQAMDVFVVSNRAYVAAGTNGLVIVDVTDATNPVVVGQCAIPDVALGVCVVSNLAFVASWGAGLQIVDVQDASNPRIIGVCDTPGYARRVNSEGCFAFVADGGSGVEVIDVACATNPVHRGTCNTAAWVQDVSAVSGIVYAAVSEAGLQVFRIAGLDENQNGIPDDWEKAALQGLMSATDMDTDDDGISDWGEYIAGMNPTNSDQDADGMPDGWEVRHMLDPRINDVDGDLDGDGFSNRSEFLAGTDPNNASSYLGMKGAFPQPDGQGVVIHWSSVTGKFYILDRSTNLMDSPSFMTVETNVAGQAGTTSYTDTNAVGPGPVFYRVLLK
jgi:hypothetical protein